MEPSPDDTDSAYVHVIIYEYSPNITYIGYVNELKW